MPHWTPPFQLLRLAIGITEQYLNLNDNIFARKSMLIYYPRLKCCAMRCTNEISLRVPCCIYVQSLVNIENLATAQLVSGRHRWPDLSSAMECACAWVEPYGLTEKL